MKTKIKSLLAVTVMCLIGLTGCFSAIEEGTAIKEGTIVDKEYRPSYYTYMLFGKYITPNYNPEQYFFIVKGEIEGESQQNKIEVSCDDYYSYEVGDWYSTEN